MEATVRRPRKKRGIAQIIETGVSEPASVDKEKAPAMSARKRKASTTEKEIVFMKPSVPDKTPSKASRKRKAGEENAAFEAQEVLAVPAAKAKSSGRNSRRREASIDSADKDLTVVAVSAPAEKVTKPLRKRKVVAPTAKLETTGSIDVPKPVKKKKATQASWDKWVKATVVAVSPDVWNIHASELSHSAQFLTDLRKLPAKVLLDTPTLDYLFRCPDRLSHNARLVLNEEGVECLVSLESLHEWSDKMRTGHYLIGKENGFFDKILDRFDVGSTATTTEIYQKYISLKASALVDISWERKPEDIISARLDADERPTRILAAQALVLGVPILSPDLRYEAYRKDGLKTVW